MWVYSFQNKVNFEKTPYKAQQRHFTFSSLGVNTALTNSKTSSTGLPASIWGWKHNFSLASLYLLQLQLLAILSWPLKQLIYTLHKLLWLLEKSQNYNLTKLKSIQATDSVQYENEINLLIKKKSPLNRVGTLKHLVLYILFTSSPILEKSRRVFIGWWLA